MQSRNTASAVQSRMSASKGQMAPEVPSAPSSSSSLGADATAKVDDAGVVAAADEGGIAERAQLSKGAGAGAERRNEGEGEEGEEEEMVDRSPLSPQTAQRRDSLEKRLLGRPEQRELKGRHILLDTTAAP
ncbi:hypothetical protein LTR28_011539, partial [Elasticomyces elasticus]